MSSATTPLPSVASASSTRTPAPLPLPAPVSAPSGSLYLRSPASGVSVGWGVVCVGFCTGIASGSSWCFFSFYCLDSSICAYSCSSLAFDILGVACLFCSWIGLSSAGFCGSLFTGSDSPWCPSVFSCLCSAPLAGLYGFASPLSGTCGAPCLPAVTLPGGPVFSAASALPPFCAAPLGSAAVLFGFASASAGSSFGFVGSAPQPGSAPAYNPLSGTSAAPSVLLSQCLVWSYCPFAPGLLLQSLPVLQLRFLRLSFLTFAFLRLRWCLTYISIGLFRQNTYLQNKKHTLTCQRWDWLL